MNKQKEGFSKKLSDLLEEKKMKQIDLVNMTGLSEPLISQYLSGKFEPKVDKAILIANALDVSPEYLLGLSNGKETREEQKEEENSVSNQTFGHRLKQRREQLGYSFEKLEKLSGVPRSVLHRYQHGDVEKVSVSAIEPVAKALKINPIVLMGWEDHFRDLVNEMLKEQMPEETIGSRIKDKRLKLNMTLETLANKVGTTRQTVHRYETGEIVNMPYETIEGIAEVLEVTPIYLLGWEKYIKED